MFLYVVFEFVSSWKADDKRRRRFLMIKQVKSFVSVLKLFKIRHKWDANNNNTYRLTHIHHNYCLIQVSSDNYTHNYAV